MSSESRDPFGFAETISKRLKKMIKAKQWDVLLSTITVSIWLLFNPGNGAIIQTFTEEQISDNYVWFFWIVMASMIIISLLSISFYNQAILLGKKVSKTNKFIAFLILGFILTTTSILIFSF